MEETHPTIMPKPAPTPIKTCTATTHASHPERPLEHQSLDGQPSQNKFAAMLKVKTEMKKSAMMFRATGKLVKRVLMSAMMKAQNICK